MDKILHPSRLFFITYSYFISCYNNKKRCNQILNVENYSYLPSLTQTCFGFSEVIGLGLQNLDPFLFPHEHMIGFQVLKKKVKNRKPQIYADKKLIKGSARNQDPRGKIQISVIHFIHQFMSKFSIFQNQ